MFREGGRALIRGGRLKEGALIKKFILRGEGFHFLQKDESNFIRAKTTGKRMREAYEKDRKVAITLDKELAKRKAMFTTLGINHKPKGFYRSFPTCV